MTTQQNGLFYQILTKSLWKKIAGFVKTSKKYKKKGFINTCKWKQYIYKFDLKTIIITSWNDFEKKDFLIIIPEIIISISAI